MTSKSILEQMNQTEKRFFPDSSPVTSAAKRTKTSSSPRGTSTPLLTARKRTRDNGISLVDLDGEEEDRDEEDDRKTKTGKFCHCSECYAEAAGFSILTSPIQASHQHNGFTPKKIVFLDDSSFIRPKEEVVSTCDKGTEMEYVESRPEIIIR
jgi:hypothetical protein